MLLLNLDGDAIIIIIIITIIIILVKRNMFKQTLQKARSHSQSPFPLSLPVKH